MLVQLLYFLLTLAFVKSISIYLFVILFLKILILLVINPKKNILLFFSFCLFDLSFTIGYYLAVDHHSNYLQLSKIGFEILDYIQIFNIYILTVYLIICALIYSKVNKKRFSLTKYKINIKNLNLLTTGFVLIYFSNLACMIYFGLIDLTKREKPLPYGLNGIFEYMGTIVLPIFTLYLMSATMKFKKTHSFLICSLIVYAILFAYASSSKAGIIVPLLPLLLWLICSHGILRAAKYLVPLFLSLIVMFPLFQYYRSVIKNNVQDIDYIGITLHVLKYFDVGIILNNILSRIFRDVYSLIQTFKYLDEYFIFNLSQIIKKGSSSKFFTEEVLGFYIDGHSSGTTFLNDSLMSFGLIGLFLFPLLLITFIGFLEYLNLSIFYKSFFMFYIFIFIQNGFLNFFIKVWPFVFTFFVIIVLHLSRRIIYKRQCL